MGDYCTNCETPATRRYALTFDGARTISGLRLCDSCLAAFRAEEWIDVADPPKVE